MNTTYQVQNTYRSILLMALPMVVSLSIPQIQQFVNTAFLGHFSTATQSALGIGSIYYLFILSVSIGMSSGMLVLFSRFNGENDSHKITQHLNTILWTCLMVSLVVMVSAYVFFHQVFVGLMKDEEVTSLATQYMSVRLFSFPFFIISGVLNSLYISVGKAKVLVFITLSGALTHIGLDYIFVFGHLGFSPMGITGTAWASVISELVMLLMSFFIFYKSQLYTRFKVKVFSKFDISILKVQVTACAPLVLQYMITLGGWLVFFVMIENQGQITLAASQTIRSAMGIAGVVAWAFGSVANSYTSNLIGQNKSHQILAMLWKIAKLGMVLELGFTILYLVLPEQVLSLLTDDIVVIKTAIPGLKMIGWTCFLMTVSSIFFNGVIGTGKTWASITIELLGVVIYLAYLYFVVATYPGDTAILWSSEFVYWFVLLALALLYFRFVYFRKQVETKTQ